MCTALGKGSAAHKHRKYRFVGMQRTSKVIEEDNQQEMQEWSAEAQIGASARDAIMPTSAESSRKWQLGSCRPAGMEIWSDGDSVAKVDAEVVPPAG